jgi:hypothetical protein
MRWVPLFLVLLIGCGPTQTPLAPADATSGPEAPSSTLDVRLVNNEVAIPAATIDEYGFNIRSVNGDVIISTGDIVEYEWATHTIRLRPGVKDRVFHKLIGELIEGSPFEVYVGGRPVYRGVFTSSLSSISQSTVVICDTWWDGKLHRSEDFIRLEIGYPSSMYFKGVDPRGDASVRTALEDAGKLR